MIVDIRSEAQRLSQGLVPGAIFIPRNSLEWRADSSCEYRDPRLAAVTGPLVLMCAQGYESSLAAANLQKIGVAAATDMVGGFEAWAAAGLPVAAPAPADAHGRRRHWDRAYGERAPERVSWHEGSAATSLAMIDGAGALPSGG